MRILVLNGPNLNLLGRREPDAYGSATLADLETLLTKRFTAHAFEFHQGNIEGELIDKLHEANDRADGVIFNPGGYTHSSVALRDAVAAIDIPVVEVHISNTAAREPFRHVSLIAPVCAGQIAGFGLDGYCLAVYALEAHANRPDEA